MSKHCIMVFCSIEPKLQQNATIMNRLVLEGFRKSKQKTNLFYKALSVKDLQDKTITVSYYYYLNNKRKSYSNKDFDAIVYNTTAQLEREEYAKSFNDFHGYSLQLA